LSLTTPGKHSRRWKEWRRAGQGKGTSFFMEHREAVLESLQQGLPPIQVLLSTSLYNSEPQRWEELAHASESSWFLLEDQALNGLLSVKSSSGLCGLYEPRESSLEELLKASFILITWQLQDPGNLGTVLRSCAGLAQGAVLAVGGCRAWSSKVARSSAGALLRIPVAQLSLEKAYPTLEKVRQAGFTIYSATPRGGESPLRVKWSDRDALLIGNETHGVPEKILETTKGLTLPMTSRAESLNAGVAASILMYERMRMK